MPGLATIKDILRPRGIALVGVSPSSGGYATKMTLGLKKAGFENIYPVNPKYREVFDLPCYPSLDDVPGVVDHVVVAVNANVALSLIDDCARKGVRSMHFWSAGFRETGQREGVDLEKKMLEKARAAGIRLIGPNAGGILSTKHKLLWSPLPSTTPGPIGFISQSGGHSGYLPVSGEPRGLHFSSIVSYGNAIDVNECELFEYFAEDPDTTIIGAYIEGTRDGRRFFDVLKKAALKKPIAIHKGGTTEAGKRAALGHTASLTRSATVFKTACTQAGCILAEDIDELRDILVALRFFKPIPKGYGIAVIGQGGGASVWASDEIEKAGLHMPTLSQETQTALKAFLPEAGAIFSNPLDSPLLFKAKGILATGEVLGKLPEFDMFMYHLGFHPNSRWAGPAIPSDKEALKPMIDAILETQSKSGKPFMMVLGRAFSQEGMRHFLTVQEAFVEAELPVFYSLNQAAKAVFHVINWNVKRKNHVG